jgi:hypothetical protein
MITALIGSGIPKAALSLLTAQKINPQIIRTTTRVIKMESKPLPPRTPASKIVMVFNLDLTARHQKRPVPAFLTHPFNNRFTLGMLLAFTELVHDQGFYQSIFALSPDFVLSLFLISGAFD